VSAARELLQQVRSRLAAAQDARLLGLLLRCSGPGVSIASSNIVPRPAAAALPARSRSAPVNAPRTWPKNSPSARGGGTAPQATATNGSAQRAVVQGPGPVRLAAARLAGQEHRNILFGGQGQPLDPA
jgi:hypothetical protein